MTAAPERMEYPDKARIRRAMFAATQLWPGPVGETLGLELEAWAEFGWRLAGHGRTWRLVAEIERRHAETVRERTYG